MKRLQEYTFNEMISCEGWLKKTYNSNTQTFKVDIETKIYGVSGKLTSWINQMHPLFDVLTQFEDRFYARIQAVTMDVYNKKYSSLKVNLLSFEAIDYVEPLSVNIEDLTARLKAHFKTFHNRELFDLCIEVLKDPFYKERIFESPSYQTQSYAYKGGLLQHIVRLMDLIDQFAPIMGQNHFIDYQASPLNMDLLKTAAFFHDLGVSKALFINSKGEIERTLEGELIGSTSMSIEILTQMLLQKPLSDSYLSLNLRGIISSCKADVDEGILNNSRNLPKTKEAVFFANLERLEFQDSCFQVLERGMIEPGMTKHSRLFVVPNRMNPTQNEEAGVHEEASIQTPESIPTDPIHSEQPDTPVETQASPSVVEPMMQTEESFNEMIQSPELSMEQIGSFMTLDPLPVTPSVPENKIGCEALQQPMISEEIQTSLEEQLNQELVTFEATHPMTALDYEQMLKETYDQSEMVENPESSMTPSSETNLTDAPLTTTENIYTRSVDPVSGVPLPVHSSQTESYSMEYDVNHPLNIPDTFPPTPMTRPKI